MGAKKCLLATLAGAVTLFVTGGLAYELLLADFMEANTVPGVLKEQPELALLFVGEIILGAFLTLVLSRWSGIGSFMDGAKAGAALGVLLALGLNIEMYSTANVMEAVAIPADTLVNTVRMSLAGGAIAAVLGRT